VIIRRVERCSEARSGSCSLEVQADRYRFKGDASASRTLPLGLAQLKPATGIGTRVNLPLPEHGGCVEQLLLFDVDPGFLNHP
jgi:hypothetical protein